MRSDVSIRFGDLITALFLERPNRFLVRCQLQSTGEVVEAHLADPGRLKELMVPGALLYLRFVNNPTRKTKWSVVLVKAPDQLSLVSLQSTLANHLAHQALAARAVSGLEDWQVVRPEFTYGKARWDFLLENTTGKQMLLEVKSCTLVQDGVAMFPDAVTERGRKHVQALTRLHASGEFACAMLFVVQRSDANLFKPAEHIDPAFDQAFRAACDGGVQTFVYNCRVDDKEISWGTKIPIHL
ncbi:MAG: DNA/RNA nuclease SfsA [Firmicutes bacterium]|nr:DNA/RNA nuclease SfsA [Bacillota bacterium]